MTSKSAQEFIEDLVRKVEAPRGCAISLTETTPKSAEDCNWIAAAGVMPLPALDRYNHAVAELRRQHPLVDWSGITEYNGERRRIARWLSEVK